MRVSRQKTSLLLLFLLTFFSITIVVRAEDDESDDYEVKARVVRISLIDGNVNLKRHGKDQDWEPAQLNYPLVEGDTVATDGDSRLEIQLDARNFVRLAPNSILRIVTLRDEGVALSIAEGTVTAHLAKFDAKKEYFEIDAPKTTMAAEKEGWYRVDVPRDGRVRLTVRERGVARIYSDTSGFTLRDGRSAVLVATGETAGDWEFVEAAARDAFDDWASDRQHYVAQLPRGDVKYFDEYAWGAEELGTYGDWINTGAYGWVWRPYSSFIGGYADWAPYRYGHWTWCPPYGWTWVGYEPWGWAPYHYGRWVFYNNYWAWCPRSNFYQHRSWWRPALVAFVTNVSFGSRGDVCWYPLSYYQRDPHSRRYRHNDRYNPPGNAGGRGQRPPYQDGDGNRRWRGVTRVPRTDFGRPNRRGQAVDEPTARRVIDSEPVTGQLPGREAFAGNTPRLDSDDGAGRGRSGRRFPVMNLPERRTGATERTPGVALDDDLRRSRVFRGREPRTTDPARGRTQPNLPAGNETERTGVVSRPEPRDNPNRRGDGSNRNTPPAETPSSPNQPQFEGRPGRFSRPSIPEGAEKRTRGQMTIENVPRTSEPRNQPQPRNDPATVVETPTNEAPTSQPRPEPVRPQPRVEPRSEPRESRPEPRVEQPRESRPEPRVEQPRSQPRESRPEPRVEQPRSEPRHESPRPDPPARSEPPRSEPPRAEAPRTEAPRSETPRESPKPDRPDRPSKDN